jgi:WD40 repeat protein
VRFGSGQIEVWEIASGRVVTTFPGPEAWINAAAFSPDGATLAVSYNPNDVKLWSLASGRDTATLRGHEHVGYTVLFTRDGQTLATSSLDYTIRLWRAPRVGWRIEH